jgi:hypothetical protein
MNYEIYQINSHDLGLHDDRSSQEFDVYYNTTRASSIPDKTRGVEAVRQAFKMGGLYAHVADIEAGGLEDVFHIGNMGPEKNITRYAPMHSLSVGDVVHKTESDSWFVVADFGFVQIDNLDFYS